MKMFVMLAIVALGTLAQAECLTESTSGRFEREQGKEGFYHRAKEKSRELGCTVARVKGERDTSSIFYNGETLGRGQTEREIRDIKRQYGIGECRTFVCEDVEILGY